MPIKILKKAFVDEFQQCHRITYESGVDSQCVKSAYFFLAMQDKCDHIDEIEAWIKLGKQIEFDFPGDEIERIYASFKK